MTIVPTGMVGSKATSLRPIGEVLMSAFFLAFAGASSPSSCIQPALLPVVGSEAILASVWVFSLPKNRKPACAGAVNIMPAVSEAARKAIIFFMSVSPFGLGEGASFALAAPRPVVRWSCSRPGETVPLFLKEHG